MVHIYGSVMQLNSDLVTVEAFKYSKLIVVFKKSITQTCRPPLATHKHRNRAGWIHSYTKGKPYRTNFAAEIKMNTPIPEFSKYATVLFFVRSFRTFVYK